MEMVEVCQHLRHYSSSSNKPSWLLSSLADLDQKIRTLVLNSQDDSTSTFAERAEFYYQQRPQLVSLLQDLYQTYLSLAERYSHQKHNTRSLSAEHFSISCSEFDFHVSDDAESSLSYEAPQPHEAIMDEVIISELVLKNVEVDLMVHELGLTERWAHESSRKIELQKSLLEVLESERLILLNQNASLRYKVGALINENKGLASESMFMKRKAGELARCVLKMRDDHRMNRKIEDLQGKIYGLEKKNQEYYQQLVKKEESECSSCKGGVESSFSSSSCKEGVNVEVCFQGKKKGKGNYMKGETISKWWEKVKKSDILFICKPH